jgi:hypothetical protein
MVMAVFVRVMVLAFTAFTIDVGYIALTKTELKSASDAAAMAGALELVDGVGMGASLTTVEVDAAARSAGIDIASHNRAGDANTVYADAQRDFRVGQLVWDAAGGSWYKAWGVAPYNLFEATMRRDQGGSSNGDGDLPLFFAPVIGHDKAGLATTSTAALIPGVGFRITGGSPMTAGILPITLDNDTWNALMAGVGDDDFSYNEDTGAISSGPDGILEVNLYPTGSTILPPGNRGTVDIGHQGNSTNDIKRQILYGLNESDLQPYGGEFRFDSVPMILNGDTGLSAGIKAELNAIKGQPRAIPIFSSVSGPGNNANYVIIKFVGIRILDVKLTGNPNGKHVTVQPAPFIDPTVIPGEQTIQTDSILSPVSLIR